MDANMDFTLWINRMEAAEEELNEQQKMGIVRHLVLPPDTAECWCVSDNPWHCIAMKLGTDMRTVIDQNIEPCECSCHPKDEEKPDVGTKPSGLRGARRR